MWDACLSSLHIPIYCSIFPLENMSERHGLHAQVCNASEGDYKTQGEPVQRAGVFTGSRQAVQQIQCCEEFPDVQLDVSSVQFCHHREQRASQKQTWCWPGGCWPAGCCDSLPAALCAETAGGRWAGDKHSKAVFNQLERLLDFSFEVSCLLNFIDVPDVPWSFWYSWIILDILIFLHLLRLTVWHDLIYQDIMIWHDITWCHVMSFNQEVQKWPILNCRKL